MERDPQISKLIRESGLVTAPDGFSSSVMELLSAEPQKKVYKPLIGRGGRIMIILFVATLIVLSIVYSEPGGRFVDTMGISSLDWQMPHINWNLDFLSEINISTGVVAAIVAIFILVLSDAGLSRRKFIL